MKISAVAHPKRFSASAGVADFRDKRWKGSVRTQFPLRLMNKDFRLILDKAARLYAPMPATAAAFQINVARAAKSSEEDFSSVIDEMEKSAAIDRNQTKAG